jgi:hypothetical protein
VVVVGWCDHETRGEEGFGSKYLKPSCYGSVSGMPCEMTMGVGAWGRHGSTY